MDERTPTDRRTDTVTVELPRREAQILHGMVLHDWQTAERADAAATYAAIAARIETALSERERSQPFCLNRQ